MRYMAYEEIALPVTEQWIIFADEADISDYAMNAIQAFNKLGIINGTGVNAEGQIILMFFYLASANIDNQPTHHLSTLFA